MCLLGWQLEHLEAPARSQGVALISKTVLASEAVAVPAVKGVINLRCARALECRDGVNVIVKDATFRTRSLFLVLTGISEASMSG